MAGRADLAARLAAESRRWNCRITTRGRRTGKPHSVTIWFLVDGTTLWLGTMNAKRDWVRNVMKNPDAEFQIGDLRVRGRVVPVADPAAEARHVEGAFLRKYWPAWIASWFGIRSDRMFRVDGLTAVA